MPGGGEEDVDGDAVLVGRCVGWLVGSWLG
jgi:hypothetical protein